MQERLTKSEREIIDKARAFHIGDESAGFPAFPLRESRVAHSAPSGRQTNFDARSAAQYRSGTGLIGFDPNRRHSHSHFFRLK